MVTTKAGESILAPGWLEQIRVVGGTLTELQLVDRALKFANSGSFKSHLNFRGQLQTEFEADGADQPPPVYVQADRLRLKDGLRAIVEGRASERAQTWRTIADGILPIENTTDSRRYHYLEVVHYDAGTEATGLFALVLLWLQDPNRPYRKILSQCQYCNCGNFFLVKPPKRQGKPLRRYCKPEHMQAAHKAGAVERVRRSRERTRAAKHK
jgi:hypothetical protein